MTQSTQSLTDADVSSSESPKMVEAVKVRAAEAVDQVKSLAGHQAETIRQRAERAAEGKRLRAAGGVQDFASAAQQFADGLREQQQPIVADVVERGRRLDRRFGRPYPRK